VFRDKLVEDPLPARRLNAALPRDLETILHKCLARSPWDRYASAEELADDLQRFLSFRPIQARPASRLERGLNVVRRYRGVLGSALGAARHRRRDPARRALHRAPGRGALAQPGRAGRHHRLRVRAGEGELERAAASLNDLTRVLSPEQILPHQRRLDRVRGETLLAEARAKQAELARWNEESLPLEQDLTHEESALRFEYFDDGRRARLHELRHLVPARAAEPERRISEIEGLLVQARDVLERADVPVDAVANQFAQLYITAFRRARSMGRWREAEELRKRVTTWDRTGQFVQELSEQGTLALGEATGARHLFRYEEDDRYPGRLVPVPFQASSRDEPRRALEVTSVTGAAASDLPLVPGDLILDVEGAPATETLLVEWVSADSVAARTGVTPYARILTMNDRPVASTADWSRAFDLREPAQRARLATPKGALDLVADGAQHPNEAFGLFANVASAVLASTAPPYEIALRTLCGGVPESITLAKGAALRIHARPTAYPLVLGDEARVEDDGEPIALQPGAYLLVENGVRRPLRIEAARCNPRRRESARSTRLRPATATSRAVPSPMAAMRAPSVRIRARSARSATS
jgi:hypothetical protein